MRVPRILITDNLAPEGVDLLREHAEVEVAPTLTEDELIARLAGFDALIVRSATKVTKRVIDAADTLRVVGRAGVGVENIDLDAATRRGIVVVNSPAGNTLAAAELTIAMMLALARRIPHAHASTQRGEWKRAAFLGRQLHGKVLGIVGLGRVGIEVAVRTRAFGMTLLGYDPYLSPERAKELGVESVDLPTLYQRADFITLHCALTKETRQLINRQSLGQMKRGVYLINCARGEIVDEAALAEALQNGRVSGAALDTFEREPPIGSPLLALDTEVGQGCPTYNLVLTPHLGASTAEAQVEVAVDLAQQVLDALAGRVPRYALNLPPIAPEQRAFMEPFLTLAERMGALHSQLAQGAVERVELAYAGDLVARPTEAVKCAFLKGLLQPMMEETVNWVNAPLLAQSRGIVVRESKTDEHEDYQSLVTATVITALGGRELQGTVFGRREPRLVSLDSRRISLVPEGTVLLVWNYDRPGMIGSIGTLLGEAKVNIANMEVGRADAGVTAVMALMVDSPVPQPVIDAIATRDGILTVKQVDFRSESTLCS